MRKKGGADPTLLAISRLDKQIKIDKQEISEFENEALDYLISSVENYLIALTVGDQKLEQIALRLCSIWFSNCYNGKVNTMFSTSNVPSDRFLIVVYQLSARLVAENSGNLLEKQFHQVLLNIQ